MTTPYHRTTSNMGTTETNPSHPDQAHLYQLLDIPGPLPGNGDAEGTALGRAPPLLRPTATAAGPTVVGGAAASGHAPEGRAGKAAARRRPRAASRRTPTTILSTDPVNFRAMVQQFTGAHPAPFQASVGGAGQAALGFGLGGGVSHLHQHPAVLPFGSQLQQQYQFHQNQERTLFAPGGSGHTSAALGGDAFLQSEEYVDVSDRLPPEGVSHSDQSQTTPRAAASSGRRSTTGSFFR